MARTTTPPHPPSPSPAPLNAPPAADASALNVAPFISAKLLRRYGAFISTDTRFAAATRLLAALWREDQGLLAGIRVTRNSKGEVQQLRAGWRLRASDARAGSAFLDPLIPHFVRKALILREAGALWDVPKIQGNLLSSAGLALNLFVPQALDLALASRVWAWLMPDFIHHVTAVRFETSPGRGDPAYLSDFTAFDLVLDIVTPDGEPGFVAVELKFIEDMVGPAATLRPRYREATRQSRLFLDPEDELLYRPGLEQLRREHCLAQIAVDQGLASRARFVLIGPRLNRRVAASAKLYAGQLIAPIGASPDRVGFVHLTLETILAALHATGGAQHAGAVFARYLDLERVAALAFGDTPPEPPSRAPTSVLLLPAPGSPAVNTPALKETIQPATAGHPSSSAPPPCRQRRRPVVPMPDGLRGARQERGRRDSNPPVPNLTVRRKRGGASQIIGTPARHPRGQEVR